MIHEAITDHPKTCLECGKELGAGRRDRKYCDDICRTAYNNRRREDMVKEPDEAYVSKPAFQKIYQILISNRDILELHDLYVPGPYFIRDLLGKGFNPKYFTSELTIEDLGLFKFCFDYGYHIAADDRVYIVERKEEI